MDRRTFAKLTIAGALAGPPGMALGADKQPAFKALFAPSFDQLPTGPKGYIDQLKFAHDLGFRGWEDNKLIRRDPKLWPKIGEFCKDNGISLGVTVVTNGHGIDFSNPSKKDLAKLTNDMKKAVVLAKATGQTFMTFVPGGRNNMPRNEQIRKSVDTMNRCCDIVEESGIILVQEPLSHPMVKKEPLIRSFADGHLLCKSVNRKSCKLLADFYHEGEIGNGSKLIENAEKVWDQVAYVQYGDSPGRKEPGTGELDYAAVTKWLRKKGYAGIIGMEHRSSSTGQEGLDALIAAYRKIDA